MEADGTSTRKRKSAALEGCRPAPASASGAADPGSGDDDGGGPDKDLVDRISSLPNEILGEIISLLPIEQGARTRILAKRWRHLWSSSPLNLDFHHITHSWYRILHVVLCIISSHQGPGRRFRTSWLQSPNYKHAVEACLLSPALDNLQELELVSWQGHPIPASVFRFSPTLCSAYIGDCSLPDATVQGIQFPLLKQLRLVQSSISEGSLHRMIANCPSLECLLIYSCTGSRSLRINSPVLTSVGVKNYSKDAPMIEELIIESAPRLESLLHLDEHQGLRVSVLSAPNLETIGCTNATRLVFGSTEIQVRKHSANSFNKVALTGTSVDGSNFHQSTVFTGSIRDDASVFNQRADDLLRYLYPFIAANVPLLLRLPPLYNKSAPTSFPIPISPLQSRRSQSLAAPPPLALPISSSHKNVAAKGFGHSCLTVAEAWALYHAGYLVPLDMRVPSSGCWRMAVNGVGFRRRRRRDAIRTRRDRLSAKERADPT
ncbi:hypothetical protein QYE76_065885 [Lolium multiflorum]|uniref:F-box domain-containing protein n=1 Tax=Lolium multiflorum TaxID=4521 RepID=A0AAD8WAC2_LOLMU|nr:hypothetical protein QYE76_065885 [Lolium multiflorum]